MAGYLGRIDEFDENVESWDCYTERVEQFFKANKITEDDQKVAVLITSVGSRKYQELRDTVSPQKPSELSYKEINEAMSKWYNPKGTIVLQRYRFHTHFQKEESVTEFTTALRRLAAKCEFKTFLDEALRDQFVVGLKDGNIQRKLLGTVELDFEAAQKTALAMEAATKDCLEMSTSKNAVPCNKVSSKESSKSKSKASSDKMSSKRVPTCYCCGVKGHVKPECPHLSERCTSCKIKGHLSTVCRKKQTKAGVHVLSDTDDNSTDNESEVYRINVDNNKPITVDVLINHKKVNMEIDTGAKLSIISRVVYDKLPDKPELQHSETILKTYSGEKIIPAGEIEVEVEYNDQILTLPLIVAPGKTVPLLGRDWMSALQLDWPSIHPQWANVKLLDDYPTLFGSGGKLKNTTVSLNIDQTVPPKFHKARPLPYTLRNKVEEELDRLVTVGTISPVSTSKWASPIVPVVKSDGSVRICGDYKVAVNKALVSDIYPLPTTEDLFASLAGGKVFSKLDLTNAYQQLAVSEESREILTINTHKGLFTYNRLPFGISSAPAVFQRTLEELFRGQQGVAIYLNDILVTGRDADEHNERLQKVLETLSKAGLCLKKSKCLIGSSEVEYLGHKISAEGIKTLSDKVEGIAKAPVPEDKKQLQSFVGMVTYYDKFLPNLSTVLEPLHKLLRKDVKFKWGKSQQSSFEKCKEMLQEAPVLTHFDPSKPLVLTVDASPYGLGAVLGNSDGSLRVQPIAYKSRKLTKAERNYAQLDKEALAIAFGIHKFHKYLYGRKFKIVTDHKPLLGLLGQNKSIPDMTSPRLQRFAIMLSAYNYELVHVAGEKISNADGLSRLPMDNSKDSGRSVNVPGAIIMNLQTLDLTPVTSEHIKRLDKRG